MHREAHDPGNWKAQHFRVRFGKHRNRRTALSKVILFRLKMNRNVNLVPPNQFHPSISEHAQVNVVSPRNLFLSTLFAASTTLAASAGPIQVTLVDAGSPAVIAPSVTIDGSTIDNVYIGPYTLGINGQDVAAMCIDFNIVSVVGTTYSANVTTVGSSNLSNTYSPAEGQVYEEEAYLFSQIVQASANRTAIQEAAWDITAYDITNTSYSSQIADNSYIDAALANYSHMSGLYDVISDTTKGGEQEFIVDPSAVTPEPSSFVLLLGPALLMGAEAVRRSRLNATSLS